MSLILYHDPIQNSSPDQNSATVNSVLPYLRIPLEVDQDELSDGAKLLFGDIFGLESRYGKCNAGDDHFQKRRKKGRSSIQRLLGELEERGHIRIITDKHSRREIRVAQRYLPSKDASDTQDSPDLNFLENEKDAEECLENEKDNLNFLKNETPNSPNFLKNETHKTQESYLKNQEFEITKTPESCRSISNLLSDEGKAKVTAFAETVKSSRIGEVESLLISAIERGREDAWDAAAEVTAYDVALGDSRPQGRVKDPLAWFRGILRRYWEIDRTLLEETISDWRLKQNPQAQHKNADWDSHLAREKAAHNGPVAATVKEMVSKTAKPMPIPNGTESSSSYRQYIPPTVMTTQNAPQTVPGRQEAVPGRQECQAYYDALDACASAALDAQALADTLPTSRRRHRFVRENRNKIIAQKIIAQKIIADKIIAARSETEFSL